MPGGNTIAISHESRKSTSSGKRTREPPGCGAQRGRRENGVEITATKDTASLLEEHEDDEALGAPIGVPQRRGELSSQRAWQGA